MSDNSSSPHSLAQHVSRIALLLGVASLLVACGSSGTSSLRKTSTPTGSSSKASSTTGGSAATASTLDVAHATWSRTGDMPANAANEQWLHCMSTDACLGEFQVGNTPGTQFFDGSDWSTKESPTSTSDYPSTVSCPTADLCWSVGYGENAGISRFDGTSWTKQEALPIHTPNAVAISCWAQDSCVIGYTDSSSGWAAASFDGTQVGTLSKPTMEPTANSANMNALSCTSATSCVAVGSSSDGDVSATWDGTQWTFTMVNDGVPPGTQPAQACGSPTFCVSGSGQSVGVWDGQQWQPLVLPENGEVDAAAASCLNARQGVLLGQGAAVVVGTDATGSDPLPIGEESSGWLLSCIPAEAACVAVNDFTSYELTS